MKNLESFFDKFTKRVMGCPSCRRKIRFPIRLGKTLRVTCPSCHCMFDISFKNKLFSLGKQKLFINKIKQTLLSLKTKRRGYLGLFVALLLGLYLLNALFSKQVAKKPNQPSVEEDSKFFKEV